MRFGLWMRLKDMSTALEQLDSDLHSSLTYRENDEQWPKRNIVGRQELEVRIDRDHISFEVSSSARLGS